MNPKDILNKYYHFAVIEKDGRELYRCAFYEANGSEES